MHMNYSKEEFQAEIAAILEDYRHRLVDPSSIVNRLRVHDAKLAGIIEASLRAVVAHLEAREVDVPEGRPIYNADGCIIGRTVGRK